MSIRCEAIVEKGLLRPLTDLGLREADRVTVTIECSAATIASAQSVRETLTAAGLRHLSIAEASMLSGGDLAEIAVDEINRTLPLRTHGKSLSAAVMEERNEGW